MISKVDALIFDMDGTLWDGVDAYAMGFNDYFKANNIDSLIDRNDLFMYMGLEEEEYLQKIFPTLTPDKRKVAYKEIVEYQYERIKTDGGILYEGVKNGLFELSQKYKLFIVSNCPELTIQHFMKWAGIEKLITDTMCYGMNYKPKHQNINYLIEKYNLISPVYIGDTDSDRKQCELINIPFAFVSYGFGTAENYCCKFDSFQELVNAFINNK